jgi:2-oxoglutarate ferredoxin oxidoreductase subunit delta
MGGGNSGKAVRGRADINAERCKGCQLCTTVCPQHVLHIDGSRLNARGFHPAFLREPSAAAEYCTGCGLCAVICPDVCITVYQILPPPAYAPALASQPVKESVGTCQENS